MQLKRSIKTSLQFRVSLVLLLTFICASVIAGWIGLRWTDQWLNASMTADADRLTDTLVSIISKPLAQSNKAEVAEIVENSLDRASIVAIAVLDYDGTCIVARESSRSVAATLPIDQESVALAYDRRIDDRHIIMARPILKGKTNSEIIGGLRIAYDTSTTQAMINQAAIMIWTLAGVIVLCMFPLTSLFIRSIIIKPLHSLASATSRLASGDYSARIKHPNTRDDLAALAVAFNLMAEQIESQHTQLVESNVNLEDKVRSRTDELDRANKRLQSRMDEHNKFMRAVSHDLNAPLRNIAGMADLTLMKWADQLPGDVADRLKRIKANVETEGELIGDLLDISRLGAAPSRPEIINTAELLTELRENFEFDLSQKQMQIHITEPMPEIFADKNLLRKVFQNLIDNAIKYMPANHQNSLVEISYDQNEQDHIFTVSDNGMGIEPSDQEKIFTVFRRGQTAGKQPGKGVGLASVAAVVARYDGAIELQSSPGRGSSFIVRLSKQAVKFDANQSEEQLTERLENVH